MLNNNKRVVVTRNGKHEIGTILERTKIQKMRTYRVLMESGETLDFVRVNRQDSFCAAYIDTNLTRIVDVGKKI